MVRPSVIDAGRGVPLVLVPGIQARWEWMRATVQALARRFRVLTFTLAGEPGSGFPFDPALGFENFVAQLDLVLDEAGVDDAVVCGVSYGGLIALRYATRRPERIRELVLVSVPAPDYEPDARTRRYLRAPRLMAPVFCAGAVARGWREMRHGLPTWRERAAFAARQALDVTRAPMRPSLMRQRIDLLCGLDFTDDARQCGAPTLLITGDPRLDRVVRVESTLKYMTLIPGARLARMEGTGHLGLVLRPGEFASRVAGFVAEVERSKDRRRCRAV